MEKMYKTETHVHTAPVSSCGRLSPREIILRYRDTGYSTVFISNHFAEYHFDRLGDDLSWEQKIDLFFGAYEEAKAVGDEHGVCVLFSAELSLMGNHYLLYGMDKAMMLSVPDIFTWTIQAFSAYARRNGITVVQAHPLRDGKCTPQPEFVDGMEAVNSNPRHENFDEQVFEIARQYGLPVSAGSDAHREEDIAGAAMLSQEKIRTVEEYVELLKSGEARLMKRGRIL